MLNLGFEDSAKAGFPLLLAGPTASGKSALALRIAERDNGVILNADALQVYDCWDVLSARPAPEDLDRAPHLLYGHVPGARRYSVGDWLRDVAALLPGIAAAGQRPIFVGGTGLYLEALTRGLATIPEVPADLRRQSEARLAAGDLGGLVAELDAETRDRIDLANPRRVQRAWEVLRATGRGIARWQAETPPPVLADWRGYVVDVETETLNNNITLRLQDMVARGALAECAAYAARFSDPTLPSAQVLGAREFTAHLRGEMSLEAALDAAAIATRQYAKRQRTWLRNRFGDWPRIVPDRGQPAQSSP